MSADVRYRRSRGVVFRAYADEVVVAPAEGTSFELLSGPAADAWRLLSEARSEAEIVKALVEAYGAPHETVAQDMRVLLEDLQARRLIDSDVHA